MFNHQNCLKQAYLALVILCLGCLRCLFIPHSLLVFFLPFSQMVSPSIIGREAKECTQISLIHIQEAFDGRYFPANNTVCCYSTDNHQPLYLSRCKKKSRCNPKLVYLRSMGHASMDRFICRCLYFDFKEV